MERRELNRLALEAQRGDAKAKEQLCIELMPAASKLASEYSRSVYGGENHVEDYRSAAYEGLLLSLDSFDSEKGQFYSYALESMRISIRSYISKSQSIIRPSKHMIEKTAKISKAVKELGGDHPESVSEAAIAYKTGLSEKVVHKTIRDMTTLNVYSLDYKYSDEEDGETSLLSACVSDSTVEEEVLNRSVMNELKLRMMSLTEQDRAILCSEFGAFGFDKLSAKALADRYSVTSTTIRNRRKSASSILLSAVGY